VRGHGVGSRPRLLEGTYFTKRCVFKKWSRVASRGHKGPFLEPLGGFMTWLQCRRGWLQRFLACHLTSEPRGASDPARAPGARPEVGLPRWQFADTAVSTRTTKGMGAERPVVITAGRQTASGAAGVSYNSPTLMHTSNNTNGPAAGRDVILVAGIDLGIAENSPLARCDPYELDAPRPSPRTNRASCAPHWTPGRLLLALCGRAPTNPSSPPPHRPPRRGM
jgi:hypothetical protein